jgi:hypothetical protein
MVVQNGYNKQVTKKKLLNEKVNKSGDTLKGELNFENKNNYGAIRKTRTIDNVDYILSLGVDLNKSARLEIYSGNTIYGQLDVRDDGSIYNGKTGNKIMEANAISAYSSSDLTLTNKDTEYTLTLNRSEISVGNKLTVSNNGVKIGEGINHIKVSGQVYFFSGVSGSKVNVRIYKNNELVVASYTKLSDDYVHMIVPTRLVSVTKNDIITIGITNSTKDGGVIKSYPSGTYLTVEVVD